MVICCGISPQPPGVRWRGRLFPFPGTVVKGLCSFFFLAFSFFGYIYGLFLFFSLCLSCPRLCLSVCKSTLKARAHKHARTQSQARTQTHTHTFARARARARAHTHARTDTHIHSTRRCSHPLAKNNMVSELHGVSTSLSHRSVPADTHIYTQYIYKTIIII